MVAIIFWFAFLFGISIWHIGAVTCEFSRHRLFRLEVKILQPNNRIREAFVCAMTADAAAGKSRHRGLRWVHLPRIAY
jgi:hypothetical protein